MATNKLKKLCPNCFYETEQDPCPECSFSRNNPGKNPAVLPRGSILNNRYVVGGIIGRGGFGITYLAYDTKLECRVAVKEYYPRSLAARDGYSTMISVPDAESKKMFWEGAQKFYDEACLVAKFNDHPNIVSVRDFFYENETVYFTMGLLNGQTLKAYLKEHGALSSGQAVQVAMDISNALLEAHKHNILHRDISPANIMICTDGRIKLLDFGSARQLLTEGSQELSVILTQGFAPLEQYQKNGKQGAWTDIYSLGATLYNALTLNPMDDPMSRLEDDSKLSKNASGIENGLWKIIQKATMLKASDRYQDISAFRADIDNLPIKAEPLTASETSYHFINETFSESYHSRKMTGTDSRKISDDTVLINDTELADESILLQDIPGYTVFCPYCGKKVSKNSAFCPNCGKKLPDKNIVDHRAGNWIKILAVALVAAAGLIALAIIFSNKSDDTTQDELSTAQEASTEDESEDTEEQEEENASVDLSEVDINAVEDSSCSLAGMIQKKKNGSYILKWEEGLTFYGSDINDDKVLARDVKNIYIDDEDLEVGILDDIATNNTVIVHGEIYFDDDTIYLKAESIKDEDGNEIKKEKKQTKEEKPKTQEPQARPQATADNSYIIPNSDTVLLSRSDVSKLSLRDINYAKNEIYARHGRLFQSKELQNYFNGKSWYHGTVAPENFSESMLSSIELKNASLLSDVEFSIAPNGYQLDQ